MAEYKNVNKTLFIEHVLRWQYAFIKNVKKYGLYLGQPNEHDTRDKYDRGTLVACTRSDR